MDTPQNNNKIINDLTGESHNITNEKLEKIKSILPNAFNEDGINFDVLKQELGLTVADESNYKFSWHGKNEAQLFAYTPSTATLLPKPNDSKNWNDTNNILIQGDNLEVLKLLQKSYANKVKMIYIDPPYNTGNDFVYSDNYTDNLQNYLLQTGQVKNNGEKINAKQEKTGRKHTNWLNMIYPRLLLAMNLLSDDGVIFISIDDNEQANLKKLCDEVFGEENFVACLVWKQFHTVKNDAKNFSKNVENILVYAKNLQGRNLIKNEEFDKSESYKFDDNDGKGKYKLDPLTAKSGTEENRKFFMFSNKISWQPPSGTYWRYSFDRLKEFEKENKIYFNKNNTPMFKRHLKDVKDGIKNSTLWLGEDVGYSINGDREVKILFNNNKYFNNPKPIKLIKKIIKITTNSNDIVLDFFAGSGTTAHAVMDLNANDGGNRKCISVQLPEITNEKSEAFKAGYKTIFDITKARIDKAGEKIIADNKDAKYSKDLSKLDIGYKVFTLEKSNIKQWQAKFERDGTKTLENDLLFGVGNIVDGRNDNDIITEIALKYGLELSHNITSHNHENIKYYTVDGNGGIEKLFVCLQKNITPDISRFITQSYHNIAENMKIVFADSCFSNLQEATVYYTLKNAGFNGISFL